MDQAGDRCVFGDGIATICRFSHTQRGHACIAANPPLPPHTNTYRVGVPGIAALPGKVWCVRVCERGRVRRSGGSGSSGGVRCCAGYGLHKCVCTRKLSRTNTHGTCASEFKPQQRNNGESRVDNQHTCFVITLSSVLRCSWKCRGQCHPVRPATEFWERHACDQRKATSADDFKDRQDLPQCRAEEKAGTW
jgi:hypothetical protein